MRDTLLRSVFVVFFLSACACNDISNLVDSALGTFFGPDSFTRLLGHRSRHAPFIETRSTFYCLSVNNVGRQSITPHVLVGCLCVPAVTGSHTTATLERGDYARRFIIVFKQSVDGAAPATTR